MKRAISGPDVVTPSEKIKAPGHLEVLYFLVTDNRATSKLDTSSDEEEDKYPVVVGSIQINAFIFGLVCDDNEVRIPVTC